jgi:TonB family protein
VTTTGSPYFIWEAKEKAVSILLDLDLVTHLDRTVVEAFFRSRQEVEGLLLGHVEQTPGRGTTVFIDAFELQERGALRLRAATHRDVVGGFRSTSGKEVLTEADREIIRGCSPESTFVFLQIRPSHTALTMANFFVLEKGSVVAHDRALEFPLSREHLEFGNYLQAAPIPPRRSAPQWLWIPAVLLGAIIFSVVSQRMSLDAPVTSSIELNQPAAALQLKAEKTNGRQFRITWDRNHPAITGAERGVLCITDGGAEQRIDLNRRQLANANAVYTSTGDGNLIVRLDVFDVANVTSESFRFSQPSAVPPPQLAASVPVINGNSQPALAKANTTVPAQSRPVQPKAAAALKIDVPQNVAVASAPAPPPESSPGPPVAVNPAPVPSLSKAHEVGALPATLPPIAAPATTVTSEEVAENRFKKAIHVIPGLRKLDKRREGDYVAPVAVQQTMPTISASVRRELGSDIIVPVKVSIDNSGYVSRVDLMNSEVDTRLAEAALNAARQWRFHPARIDEKPAASKVILRFRFHVPAAVSKEGPKIANRLPVSDSQIGRNTP